MALVPSLTTSLSGMKTAQGQLDIISRNIANVDTEGYTRKTAGQNNLVLSGYPNGVSLGNSTRDVNTGLLKSFLAANSLSGNLNSQYEYLSKTELLLGTPQGENAISANVGALQAAFETFASDVTSASGRYTLLNNAQTLASRLNSISTEIQKLRGEADMAITGSVEEINALLEELDQLNQNIVKATVLKQDGLADLEDKRDQALRSLSEKIDINYFQRENGEIVVQTQNGIPLLDKEVHKLSHTAVAQSSPTSTYAGGEISGIYVDGQDITSRIKDGELKGLIEVRDVTLPSLQSQLDELAGVLKSAVNEAHNQGTAYPATPSSLTGSRTIIDAEKQRIKIEGGDVRFTIFDKDGKQAATVSLGGDLGFTEGTVEEMTQKIQDWLTSPDGANLPQAVAKIDDEGHLVIDTGDSEYSISIMDQVSSAAGSEQSSVTIKFANNNTTNYDREFSGFSNFFGMNDFFTTLNDESIYDSKVVSPNMNLGIKDNVVLGFSTTSQGINFGSITVNANDSLQDIVNKINDNPDLNSSLRASLVPNGNGYMLRIMTTSGEQLEISENRMNGDPSSGLLERLGMHPSNAPTSSSIAVRNDIALQPTLIAGGAPEFNESSGEYQLNPANNNVANAMGKVFSETQSFGQSGTISQTDCTLANYASTFVGNIASQTSNAQSNLNYQQELTNSIATKEAKISGVDIDEELGQMIMFQQTYAACAKAFTASKEILDMLLNLV